MSGSAPMRLAFALVVLGMIVVAATISWVVLQPGVMVGQPTTPGVRVPAGSPLPTLQDIRPEDLTSSRAVSPSPQVRPRRIGDSVVYADGWKVTLLTFGNQPFPSPRLLSSTPKPGTRLVVVNLRFENEGRFGGRADSFDFRIQHGDAVRASASLCYTECAPDQLFTLELGPGGSQTRWLQFSAAVGDTTLSLVYERSGYREVVWNLY